MSTPNPGPRLLDPVESDPTLPASVDVAVIGAGIVGVGAAYALAKAGHSVALLDKGVVAGEQSSRNWGWCRTLNRDEREIPLMQHSQSLWDSLPAEIGADMGFRRNGLVYVTKDPQQLLDQHLVIQGGLQVKGRLRRPLEQFACGRGALIGVDLKRDHVFPFCRAIVGVSDTAGRSLGYSSRGW